MISLICATLGRVAEIRTLLESLKAQTYKNFELIIVDQNKHAQIKDLIDEYKNDFSIVYVRNETPGLSLNRNIGLRYAKGDIFGFPDDDCYYDNDVLENVVDTFENNPNIAYVAVRTAECETGNINRNYSFPNISKKDILKVCISYNIFVISNSVKFDERFGVGCYYSSGEETDYLYSLVHKTGLNGLFHSETTIYHPSGGSQTVEKIYRYSLGFSALMKKDWKCRRDRHALIVWGYYVCRAFAGVLTFCNMNKHWASLTGKIVGFIKFKP